MKRFTTIALAALMVLTVLASVIPASAATVDTVEIRGPVFKGNFSGNELFPTAGDLNETATINTANFAAFYYDLKTGVGSEQMVLFENMTDGTERTLKKDGGLVYYAPQIPNVDFKYLAWGTYTKVGFLAEEYVPITPKDGTLVANKLSKLLIDTDDKKSVRAGQSFELENGYALVPQQIDVKGQKVWLELTKDGEYVDDVVIDSNDASVANRTYNYKKDIGGEEKVTIIKVHIKEVFQGQVDSLAVIEGVWQISDTITEVKDDDEFGKLKVTRTDNPITLQNKDDITLTKDSTVKVSDLISFKVAKSNTLRFYPMKEISEPGTYEVRGTIVDAPGAGYYNWTADGTNVPGIADPATGQSFAAFYYDLKDDTKSEMISITSINNATQDRIINDNMLVYYAAMQPASFDYSGWTGNYQKTGFLSEEYVPITPKDGTPVANKLSKLLMDTDAKTTVRAGQSLDLKDGYALIPQQIDVDGQKVWLELSKDGEYVDDVVIDSTDASVANRTYNYKKDIGGEEKVTIIKVHIKEVFQGQVDSLAVIEGIWQISDSITEIKDDDKFGKLTVTNTADPIKLENEDTITLTKGTTVNIAGDIKIKVADASDNTIRFYPFVERTIGEADEEEPAAPVEEPEAEAEADEAEPEAEADEAEPEAPVTEPEAPVTEPEAPEVEVEPPEEEPGFEAIFAIAGLLAVAFLVRRNK